MISYGTLYFFRSLNMKFTIADVQYFAFAFIFIAAQQYLKITQIYYL